LCFCSHKINILAAKFDYSTAQLHLELHILCDKAM